MQDVGAAGGQLQHLVVGDLVQLVRVRHNAWVGGVDAVHVGVNFTFVRLHRRRNGHRAGVAAAAAEGGDVVVAVDALEACDDDDVLLVQLVLQALGVDLFDAGVAVGGLGQKARLPAGQRDDRIAHLLDGHRQQGHRDLLAGGEQHIHLAAGRLVGDLSRLGDQLVGGVALGGDDRDDRISLVVCIGDDLGNMAYALHIGDRGSTKFLYN